MQPLVRTELKISDWTGPFSRHQQASVLDALENGQVVYCPDLAFPLGMDEKSFLTPRTLDKHSKNISFNVKTGQLNGCRLKEIQWQKMKAMLARYQNNVQQLLYALIPYYQPNLIPGRTSYRPIEIFGRKTSVLKDDTRLHVDAFSATPTQGNRILRVFTNINPYGQARHWQLGEPFPQVVQRFLPRFTQPIWGSRRLMSLFGLTKSYRSLYDHYMLQLHNYMKLDTQYQNMVSKQDVHFLAGTSWIVMTDCVSHAALAGQFMLEQTFYLPAADMQKPDLSPLEVLCSLGPVKK